MTEATALDIFRELVIAVAGALFGAGGATLSMRSKLQRLEQWAWGANRTNGVDGDLKELRRALTFHLSQQKLHDAFVERRNYRQHPRELEDDVEN